jgi:hypothetical protein
MKDAFLSRKHFCFILLSFVLTIHSISQIQTCISEWGLNASVSTSRRCSLASSPNSESTDADWDAVRCPSPASSASSFYSTTPANVELYSRRPLPSLPFPRPSQTSTPSRLRRMSRSIEGAKVNTARRFSDHSSSLLTKVTSHQTKTRSYEVETTLSSFARETSPLESIANHTQSHELFAVGLRRIQIEYPDTTPTDNDDEFEWMRQFKEYKNFNTERREVRILHEVYDGDEE